MKTAKKSTLIICMALMLCVSMLMGTTYSWFTDSAVSNDNIVQSGGLDINLHWALDLESDQWIDTEKADNEKIFASQLWEPGYTEVRYFKIQNAGSLAFQYVLQIVPSGSVGALAEVIDVYYLEEPAQNIKGRTDLTNLTPVGTLADVILGNVSAGGILLPAEQTEAGFPSGETTAAIALKMRESAGNEYQGQTIGAYFNVVLHAAQYTFEEDAFGSDYDNEAALPGVVLNRDLNEILTSRVSVENGTVSAPVSLHNLAVSAEIPEGVAVAEGAEALTLTVKTMDAEESQANIELEKGETKTSLDIHVEGVAEDNTVPMLITLNSVFSKNLNTTSVELYHVEDGVTVPMTMVTNPTNHNEFSYDPTTGTVVLCVAGFSEYVAVTDNKNLWEGAFDTSWYNTTDTEFTLTTADQLAGFGKLVDEGNSFAGKTIKLGKDIDLSGGVSLNPIGCGYVTGVANSGGVTGCAFKGTFDGQYHTISGLYQSGWDLGLSYCNLGGGLFASVCDATIKNLTISGANIVMECVEMGVVVGLSQGSCTYENINIVGCKSANYQKATGGLIGEISAGENGGGTTTISNVTIDSATVVGSLWGDFDCPVGGVIGARWDDANVTEVEMTNVNVSCRLDVYNDVTSSYQWYAYRRAGMLIGNTDTPPANGKDAQTATADFLTCTNVKVYYGSWVDYHYCEFSNHNDSWPFVRVEAGENCSAFSNPRWGIPNDINGVKVTPEHHSKQDYTIHKEGDDCYVELTFNQLYGGGQGVYGQPKHDGVEVINYLYSVTYINNGKVLDVKYVTEADLAADGTFDTTNADAAAAAEASMGTDYEFSHWMNAGSTQIDKVKAGNTEDIVLYPSFKDRYTVSYVDDKGNILHWETITAGTKTTKITPDVPAIEGGYTGVWSITDFSEIEGDVTVYPIYNAEDGIVKLTPVDSEPKDGVVDYYVVTSVEENDSNVNIVIPDSFNGKPVLEVSGDAFAEFDNITTVRIPVSIKAIGADAFANEEKSGFLGSLKYEQITFLYEGTYEQWQAIKKDADWDRYVGQGSRIYFLADGTYSEETARNGTWSATDRVWSDPVEGTYSAS